MPLFQRESCILIKERISRRVYDFGFLAKKRGLILKSSKSSQVFEVFPKFRNFGASKGNSQESLDLNYYAKDEALLYCYSNQC